MIGLLLVLFFFIIILFLFLLGLFGVLSFGIGFFRAFKKATKDQKTAWIIIISIFLFLLLILFLIEIGLIHRIR